MITTFYLCSCNDLHSTPDCPNCSGPFHEVSRRVETIPKNHHAVLALIAQGYETETPEEIALVARMKKRAAVEASFGDLFSIVGSMNDALQLVFKICKGLAEDDPAIKDMIVQFENQTSYQAKGQTHSEMLGIVRAMTDGTAGIFNE